MGLNDGNSELPIPVLRPADHQVAGHRFDGGRLGSSIDESGRFYKPLQNGERGNREIEFYEKLQMDKGVPPHIRSFFPKYFGSMFVETSNAGGIRHGIMEDVTHGFQNPSIVDVKIGFRTWYPEASEHNIQKNKLKDKQTTSAALGFRVSGMQVYEASSGTTFKADRDWARNLTVDEVTVALKRFVSSNPRDATNPDAKFASSVYGGPHGVIAQLQVLKHCQRYGEDRKTYGEDTDLSAPRFSTQTNYQFAATSVLVIVDAYLVSASTKENEKASKYPVAVKLVDFAHTISGTNSLDENFLEGLKAAMHLLSSIVEEQSSTAR